MEEELKKQYNELSDLVLKDYQEIVRRLGVLEQKLEIKYENETGHALYHKENLEPRIGALEKKLSNLEKYNVNGHSNYNERLEALEKRVKLVNDLYGFQEKELKQWRNKFCKFRNETLEAVNKNSKELKEQFTEQKLAHDTWWVDLANIIKEKIPELKELTERNRLRVDELKDFRHNVAMPRIITLEEVLRDFFNALDDYFESKNTKKFQRIFRKLYKRLSDATDKEEHDE